MARKCSLLLLFLFLYCISQASTKSVYVSTQAQFDTCIKKVQAGQPISINLGSGTYILKTAITAQSPLVIRGVNAVIKAQNDCYVASDAVRSTDSHNVCKIKHPIKPFSLFIDGNDKIVPVSETVSAGNKVNFCSKIEGDYDGKPGTKVKIPLADNISFLRNKSLKNAYGYFDCAWTEVDFSVSKTDTQYLYCTTLTESNTGNFNYEKSVYRNNIRYVIYNAEAKRGRIYYDTNYIYIPKGVTKVYVLQNESFGEDTPTITALSDLVLEGITFKNFNGIKTNSSFQCESNIRNCRFYNTLSYAINVKKTNAHESKPCIINKCRFEHCSLLVNNVINISALNSNHAVVNVKGCEIKRYDDTLLMYKNCTGALMISADAVIEDCKIYNTPRCHLYINGGKVTARNNVFYNTSKYNSYKERNLSSDLGLIYVNHFTRNKQEALSNTTNVVLLENNLLYGSYAYGKDARGIFIDNGRGDVTCRYNIILDTQSFSIDARNAKKFTEVSSVRNRYEGNLLENRYRLECGSSVPQNLKPVSDGNIMTSKVESEKEGIKTFRRDDYVISKVEVNQEHVKVSRTLLRKLKSNGIYSNVKKRIASK